ncbi:DUF1415 family protein [Vibrio cincinnatiensis]|jgi:hypothetical protein|uniref:DUF1415 domain-containing protein n=1 Tax=Vibrio cincinnatiensis TaxID=675 RepID=UPI001302BA11|nr:DUF1415 family protein [Vibrio cincinnatiensis]MCG3724016.1 DUF1415 family protein [Vibrio cincinnatiensis]MCG3733491.1 DUF1415 family protein [Vibrio cincinnatiensis]MCG3737647.1 DUF1415 family protein [Vibrio cincinnatiensis]MCG3740821.1 DUF1415 family protein [Vibrio cincinnatiensis]MCG3744357.1 DUF1415 family protein [Vibrio cincinnatiensis]
MNSTTNQQTITQKVNQWLNDVVIGLNLCPFAAKPQRNKQIKIHVSQAQSEEALLQDILDQLLELDTKEPEELETTLVVVPHLLADFTDYNFYIDWVEALIRQQDWEGIFQVATFHPDYCFAGTQPDDDENLTNRSPYPIFHLIREESMEKVLKHYPNPELIPDINIKRVCQLTDEQRKALFPFLFR